MSVGSYFAQVCYPSQADALSAACSSVFRVEADGSSVRCTGLASGASSSDGGAFAGTLNLTFTHADGSTATGTQAVLVQACERYDAAYWAPVISAWVAAMVAIIAAKTLYTRIFVRETL
jgi:hypothetical protein